MEKGGQSIMMQAYPEDNEIKDVGNRLACSKSRIRLACSHISQQTT
jgi:hypothetical protein